MDLHEKYSAFLIEKINSLKKLTTDTIVNEEEREKDLAIFSGLLEDLSALKKSSLDEESENFNLNYEEIKDLPEELLKELSISKGLERTILDILNDAGGAMSLDQILIALYKKTNQIHTRNKMNSFLYRMLKKGWLYSVPGKKGIYGINKN